MRRHSPFNYGFNNPIYFTDPDGMAPEGPRNITNPRKMVLSNKTLISKLKAFDRAVARISGKKSSSFTFVISGGDRYIKNGKIYSSTNNKEIKKSATKSQHIESEGATGVDLKFADGISYDVLKKAAEETGFRIDPSGSYDDHFHLDLKNDKSSHNITKGYIPTDEDFSELTPAEKIAKLNEAIKEAGDWSDRMNEKIKAWGERIEERKKKREERIKLREERRKKRENQN